MSDRRSTGSSLFLWLPALLAGLVFGALAGATAMWLLAPRSGEKTRSQIQKQGAKMRHQAAESMDDVVTEAADKAHEFTEKVQDGVGDLQQQARGLFGKGR